MRLIWTRKIELKNAKAKTLSLLADYLHRESTKKPVEKAIGLW